MKKKLNKWRGSDAKLSQRILIVSCMLDETYTCQQQMNAGGFDLAQFQSSKVGPQ